MIRNVLNQVRCGATVEGADLEECVCGDTASKRHKHQQLSYGDVTVGWRGMQKSDIHLVA